MFVFLLAQLFSCSSANKLNQRLIVCSTSIIADCISKIVGSQFRVVSLMGPDVDPHAYNPRPNDLKLLNNASVVVYNGFHLEGKMQSIFKQLSKRKQVIALGTFFPEAAQIKLNAHGAVDPHIWFATFDWLKSLEKTTIQLGLLFPTHQADFRQRYQLFASEIRSFCQQSIALFDKIPLSKRVLITSHDAFHYFGNTFNLHVLSLQGVSTVQEPSLKRVYELVDFIVKNKVKALFIENSVSPKTVELILESARERNASVVLGGTLYSDALGPKSHLSGSYLGMLQHNCWTVYKSLK